MDVKQVAIEKALAFLKAAGADYIVRFQGERTNGLFDSGIGCCMGQL